MIYKPIMRSDILNIMSLDVDNIFVDPDYDSFNLLPSNTEEA